MLIAAVAVVALAIAGFSLARLSRLPKAPPPEPVVRTFQSLQAGDVVLTPDGDWLVEARGDHDGRAVFTLRSGREKRWLTVPPTGALTLASDAAGADARKLDRQSVELLPG